MDVALREVELNDVDVLFEQMQDPESIWMAAFTPGEPGDRLAFDKRMMRLIASPDVTIRAITVDQRLVGSIGSFIVDGDMTEVTYWIDRPLWGRGIASKALVLHLAEIPSRPIRARAASDNLASLRVLEKVGFLVVGTEFSYAPARGTEVEETIMQLARVPG